MVNFYGDGVMERHSFFVYLADRLIELDCTLENIRMFASRMLQKGLNPIKQLSYLLKCKCIYVEGDTEYYSGEDCVIIRVYDTGMVKLEVSEAEFI